MYQTRLVRDSTSLEPEKRSSSMVGSQEPASCFTYKIPDKSLSESPTQMRNRPFAVFLACWSQIDLGDRQQSIY